MYSSNGDIVPFLLFDPTKIPQKFFDVHDRYLHQKVRVYTQHLFLSEDRSAQGQPMSKDTRQVRLIHAFKSGSVNHRF